MGIVYRFNSSYSAETVKGIIQNTAKKYDFAPHVTPKTRLFYKMDKRRFELVCFQDSRDSWEYFHDVHFRGSIKPKEHGCVIKGHFFPRRDIDLRAVVLFLIQLVFWLIVDELTREMIFLALCFTAVFWLLCTLCAIPDPALMKYVTDYIEDYLLGNERANGDGSL